MQQQSRPMELYGFGDLIKYLVIQQEDYLELMMQLLDTLQSPHLLVEPTGNKLVLEENIQQQSRPMELYGLGVLEILENLEENFIHHH